MLDVQFKKEHTLMKLFWSLVVMTVKWMKSKIHKTSEYNEKNRFFFYFY